MFAKPTAASAGFALFACDLPAARRVTWGIAITDLCTVFERRWQAFFVSSHHFAAVSPSTGLRLSMLAVVVGRLFLAPVAAQPREPQTDATALGPTTSRLLRDDLALQRWIATKSPEVLAAGAELEAAQARTRGASLLRNPNLDASLSNVALGPTNPRHHPRHKTLVYSVGVGHNFELGKRAPRVQAAELRERGSRAHAAAMLGETVSEAREALALVVYAGARARARGAAMAAAASAMEAARKRHELREGSGVDYERARIALVEAQVAVQRAQADVDAARAQCSALLLLPCDDDSADLSTINAAARIPAQPPERELGSRPDILAVSLEGQAAKKDAELASARALPDLTVHVTYVHDEFTVSGDLPNAIGGSVSSPVPIFDRGQHARAQAMANASAMRRTAEAATVHARGAVTALYRQKLVLEASLDELEREGTKRAEAILGIIEHSFASGQLELTELLLARRDAIEVQLRAMDLQFELFRIRNAVRLELGLDSGP